MANVAEIVTNKLIEKLESGNVPWVCPWTAGVVPQNIKSRKPYKGINPWVLNTSGYSQPFWLTFNQCNELGGTVKKGEHGYPVVFYKSGTRKNEKTGKDERTFLARYYTVFNVEQCDGIIYPEIERFQFDPIVEAERLIREMKQRPHLTTGEARAYYQMSTDTVNMPDRDTFRTAEGYYTTFFHELAHSTRHASRLARDTNVNTFGSHAYSKEELVAEFSASFVMGYLGLERVQFDQSAAYIKGWLKPLKDDRRMLMHAAAQAQRVFDWIVPGNAEVYDNVETADTVEA